ncbi:hypothetical protein [Paraglaciecola sp. T6c]|uniref:hypothetical protein n=1 Tax=Pseudoalteromonas atlantica (strain T6c / ATCC BAA-1087) TaxID=3042615 RepID=UPI0012EEC527|nr:hypothetical protein [Paraglaciecola sp. T6c]
MDAFHKRSRSPASHFSRQLLPALLYLPTSMLVACASRLTLAVKTRSRRGFHLNDIHVINPVSVFDALGDLSR